MKRLVAILLLLTITTTLICSRANDYKYRVWLSDKATSQYTTSQPEAFLSQACIDRRNRQGCAIDERDLPVCQQYIEQIEAVGCRLVVTSRWMNTVVVAVDDTAVVADIASLPFVSHTECVWKNETAPTAKSKQQRERELATQYQTTATDNATQYGDAWQQTDMLHIDRLHNEGYRGEGMTIAVIDAGFYGVKSSSYYNHEKITFLHDFPHNAMTYGNETHGSEVLSCMAANKPNDYIGTAPEAEYILIVTEDIDSEYPIEEDYWVAGLELADSIGADIVNTSLAYNTFDDEGMNYTHNNLDGQTAFSSRAANMAYHKGLLVVVAAGNEYRNEWKKIAVPSDAEGVITVGSVTNDGSHSPFSSCGPTADGRIKPDVVAMGSNVNTITAGDAVKRTSGTSYAAPIMCGAIACLWQSQPQWSVARLIEEIQRGASQYEAPDALCGYGIPDIYAIYRNNSSVPTDGKTKCSLHYSNGKLHLPQSLRQATLTIYDTTGRTVAQRNIEQGTTEIDMPDIDAGIYIVVWQSDNEYKAIKIKR